jgi:hypothetical protein
VLEQFDVARGAVAAVSPDGRLQGFGAASLGPRRVPSSAAASLAASQTAQGSAVPAQSVVAVDLDGAAANLTAGAPPPAANRTVSYVTGPLGQAPASPFGGPRDNAPAEYRLDANNNLIGFVGPYPVRGGPSINAAFALGSAANANVGFDSVTMLRWGRWALGTVGITLPGNVDASQDMTRQSLHWISGPQNGVPTMPITGSATYRLVGATSPTDNLGNVGALGSATFAADFTNLTVVSTLNLNIGGSPWIAAGNGLIGARQNPAGPAHTFGGSYVVTAAGAAGAGFFNGFFTAPGSRNPSFPGGAGLTYALQDANGGTQVSGAAIFGDPN